MEGGLPTGIGAVGLERPVVVGVLGGRAIGSNHAQTTTALRLDRGVGGHLRDTATQVLVLRDVRIRIPQRCRRSLWVSEATERLVVAALFNPVRRRVQRRVDRRFNRSSYQAAAIAEGFSAQLQEALSVEGIAEAWIHTVQEALQPGASGAWIKETLGEHHLRPDSALHNRHYARVVWPGSLGLL